MADKKYFVLMQNGKDTAQVFHSKQPRGAALKRLQEVSLTSISGKEEQTEFTCSLGSKSKVPKGANAPDWLPDMINKANVKKLRIDRM